MKNKMCIECGLEGSNRLVRKISEYYFICDKCLKTRIKKEKTITKKPIKDIWKNIWSREE